MLLTTVTLGTLVDRTLMELRGPDHMGKRTTLTSTIDSEGTIVQLTLADPTVVNPSDLLEINDELMLVTGKTNDATPVFTVARGYYTSTKRDGSDGAIVEVNPAYPRVRVAEAVRRSFPRLEALGLPLVTTATLNVQPNTKYAVLPIDCRDVLRVSFYDDRCGRLLDLDRWEFFDYAPASLDPDAGDFSRVLKVGRYVSNDDDLIVTYRTPYRWSSFPDPPDEFDNILMVEGAEDLPANYAAAWLVGAREVARQQLERSEEWNQGEPARGGVSLSLLKSKWADFYRALDEARRLIPAVPLHRPYVKMPRL